MADGGLRPLEIQVVTPGDPDELVARIARNECANWPEAAWRKSVIIIGNGPSANDPALWERLKRESLPTLAVNNALRLFIDHGLEPTWWACCDVQADQVLPFIPAAAPKSTTYLVATKCPTALFDELDRQGLKVAKWRMDDYATPSSGVKIPCAVSITLVGMNLLRFMGFHRFEVYGWDCCYLDGAHHAAAQPTPPSERINFDLIGNESYWADWVEDEWGLRLEYHWEDAPLLHRFETIGPWIAELNDACVQAHNYRSMGYELVVHGPGAVGALLRARGLIAA